MRSIIFAGLPVLLLLSCKKGEEPRPEVSEIITTARIHLTAPGGVDTSFRYSVENGLNSAEPLRVRADTIAVQAGVTYSFALFIENESTDPVEDITEEILEEKDEHLFLLYTAPPAGAGSLSPGNGSVDNQGRPFNQSGELTAGATGLGMLRLYLMHQPTNKWGQTPEESGGETDVEAAFPVKVMPQAQGCPAISLESLLKSRGDSSRFEIQRTAPFVLRRNLLSLQPFPFHEKIIIPNGGSLRCFRVAPLGLQAGG